MSTAPTATASTAAPDLTFPSPRWRPIKPPADPTPEATIDAFLAFVRDPGLRLHIEGAGRWVVGDLEVRTTLTGDISGSDRHIRLTSSDGGGGELVATSQVMAVRAEGGDWQAVEGWEADAARSVLDLRHTIVIGDLGPDAPGGPYRLVVENGLAVVPRMSIPFTSYRPIDSTVELVIDGSGRPLTASYHRAIEGPLDGAKTRAEGIERYVFSRIGEPVAIRLPDGPLRPASPQPSLPAWLSSPIPPQHAPRWEIGSLDEGRLSVELPGTPVESVGQLTFARVAIDVQYLVADNVAGARFSVGEAHLPADAKTGMSTQDQLTAAQLATTSRISGDVLGYRDVSIVGSAGREMVVGAGNDFHRIRSVVVGDRLVTLSVSGPATAVGSPEADRFLHSLGVAR